MKKGNTILYGQIANYNQVIRNNNYIESNYNNIVSTTSEKYYGNSIVSSHGKYKISFQQPENAIQFALSTTNRFHQTPEISFKTGIIHTINNKNGHNEELAISLSDACPDGAILVSKDVVTVIDSNTDYSFVHIGSSLFKGANEPTEIYALAGSGLYIPSQNELNLGVKNKNSIAIMPFHNTSSEKELDYICDGLAEEIIDSLSKAKELFVTARSSSFMFKNKEISIQDISRKLNVSYVLDGSIRKRNNEYRISYQLVDCSNGYNIISDTITSDFDTLYDSEIKISKSITGYFNKNEPETIKQKSDDFSVNPQAYSYYLQGKYLSQQWNSNSAGAIKLFKKALDIVPDYALAYAGMSVCYTHLALNGYGDYKENITNAVLNAEKSIALDSTIPDGFTAKALASFWMGNWFVPDFEKNIMAALAISPCNAEIRMFNGMVFLIKGERKRALSELKLAKQLDPYSSSVNIRLGLVQYLNREYEDAHNTYLILLNEQKNKTYNVLRLACCCMMLKQYQKALEYLNAGDNDYQYHNMKYGMYLVIYKGLGDDVNFFKTKQTIEQLPENDTSTFYNKAVLNKLIGKHEQAIQYLEKMLQNPLFYLMFLQYDEFWEEYHEHPLFLELIALKYKGTGNQLIKIESDTKEFVEVKISDFLYAEAQDNYTLIVFKEHNRKNEKILRTTLANVEKQLKQDQIVRCHRSFLVNTKAGFRFQKIDKKAVLKQTELEITVPVSRSKEKEIKEIDL